MRKFIYEQLIETASDLKRKYSSVLNHICGYDNKKWSSPITCYRKYVRDKKLIRLTEFSISSHPRNGIRFYIRGDIFRYWYKYVDIPEDSKEISFKDYKDDIYGYVTLDNPDVVVFTNEFVVWKNLPQAVAEVNVNDLENYLENQCVPNKDILNKVLEYMYTEYEDEFPKQGLVKF